MKTLIASALLAVALGVSAASAQPIVKKPNPYSAAAQTGGDFVVIRQLDGE